MSNINFMVIQDFAARHRCSYNEACDMVRLAIGPVWHDESPAPKIVPPGFALVSIEQLTSWKAMANQTAACTLKRERHSVGANLKSEIADVIADPLNIAGEAGATEAGHVTARVPNITAKQAADVSMALCEALVDAGREFGILIIGEATEADQGEREIGLRKALQFYADGNHFVRHDSSVWDTVSGEPANFYEDEANTATVEDGSIARAALATQPNGVIAAQDSIVSKPIDMVLHCPDCGVQHIDAPDRNPELEETPWTNPPHRSHLCHACGCIWRPADAPTNGVKAVKTTGKSDTWKPSPVTSFSKK